jgi:transposase
VSHANAQLTPRARLRLARLIVENGWTYSTAAKMFMVSPRTAAKWAHRYRLEGPAGMADRSSRPHRSPTKTPEQLKRQIVRLRWRKRLGPVQIAGQLGVPASTVHAVLTRCRINRLSHIDRVTAEPIRRYEHDHPGSLIHVDVTKFGNIPDGGGHRFLSRQDSKRNARATARRTGSRGDRTKSYRPVIGTAFLHTAHDGFSRTATTWRARQPFCAVAWCVACANRRRCGRIPGGYGARRNPWRDHRRASVSVELLAEWLCARTDRPPEPAC